MKTQTIVTILLFIFLFQSVCGQDNTGSSQRTPEQEAVKQTDKLQQELNLTPDQAKQIYEINVKYARARQISNKRSEAVERMKIKNTEIQQILSSEQNNKLQSKRFERSNSEYQSVITNNLPTNANGYRSGSEFRTNSPVRNPNTNLKNNTSLRQALPATENRIQNQQSLRNNNQTQQQSQPIRGNSTSNSHSTINTPAVPTPQRMETPQNSTRR
jgi:hypothetical protein